MTTSRLLQFVTAMYRLAEQAPCSEAQLLAAAAALMKDLVSRDDWLPEAMAATHPLHYQQHLLYGDPLDRFSLVSFVWGPGQKTPIHDHTVWGIIGMLRGSEYEQAYQRQPNGVLAPNGPEQQLHPGDIGMVSPTIGDIHRVRNAYDDRTSISIHLYGGNIGRIQRHVFVADTDEVKPFVSGYSNALAPNLWAKEQA